jgi:ubiquinone/menaquinone biosynthesis C-methylase UbiE
MSNQVPASPWFKDWFEDEAYHERYMHRDDQEAESAITAMLSKIPHSNESQVLDCACGDGRYAAVLARTFKKVVGLDLSQTLLKKALARKTSIEFIRSDTRKLPFQDNSFNYIFSLFTSFGYFEKDSEHQALLEDWQRILSPDGILLLDTLNSSYIKKNLIKNSDYTSPNYFFNEEREIKNSRIIKHIEITPLTRNTTHAPKRSYHESVRIYSFEELRSMCISSGLTILKVFKNYQGDLFLDNDESERMIIVAQKIIQ